MATQTWDKCKPQNLFDRFEESRRWQRRWYCLEFRTYWGIPANACTVALDAIEKGEELFRLQLADVLSVETSRLSKLLPRELENLDEWLSLVLVLIYEYGQGEQSAWRPYLDILPARFDTLAFWTPQQLEELQGSAVVKKIGTEEADETFKTRLLPIVAVHPDIFGVYATAFRGPDAESVLLKLAHSMATLIMAYGFDLEAEQPDTDSEDKDSQDYRLPKGMVPLADMLNADGDSNNVSPLSAFLRISADETGDSRSQHQRLYVSVVRFYGWIDPRTTGQCVIGLFIVHHD